MKADLLFDNVQFFGALSAQRVRVLKGETFRINLQEVGGVAIVWATTRDPILNVKEATDGLSATVITEATGKSEIQIQGNDRNVILWLDIEVFNAGEAVKATLIASDPEPK